jgi:uncharacterized membrane protein YeiB
MGCGDACPFFPGKRYLDWVLEDPAGQGVADVRPIREQIRKLVEEKPHSVSWMLPAGKMSLTVYISQSLITSMIFGPWGLGLFQDLQTWQVLILAIGIWLALVYFAKIWLKRFKQGPLERLVNSLTRNRKGK